MKTAIIYESKHHGNTKKLCDAIAEIGNVDLIEVQEAAKGIKWTEYDLVGFASGIAYSRYYRTISETVSMVPAGTKVFFLYTCGRNDRDFSAGLKKKAEENGAVVLGSYGCSGYDTFGPFRLIGGVNKGHPDEEEIRGAVEFYRGITEKEK